MTDEKQKTQGYYDEHGRWVLPPHISKQYKKALQANINKELTKDIDMNQDHSATDDAATTDEGTTPTPAPAAPAETTTTTETTTAPAETPAAPSEVDNSEGAAERTENGGEPATDSAPEGE